MNAKHITRLFYVAALYNWLAALVFVAPLGLAASLGVSPVPVGNAYEYIMCAAIAVFGLGYWWVAKAPVRNRDIVKLGLIGKLAVVAIAFGSFYAGTAHGVFAGLASGDLAFAILFMIFLRRGPAR